MSVTEVVRLMDRLIELHQTLLEGAMQKTEILKEGSIDKLQTLLVQERKTVQALEQAEKKRQHAVKKWFSYRNIPVHPTVTAMLEHITDETEKNDLEAKAIALIEVITRLKKQEHLNQELLRQSMQFVQMSLDMIQPTLEHMNYGQRAQKMPERSMFDSKA